MTDQNPLITRLKSSPSEDDRKQCIPLLQAYLAANPTDAVAWYDLASCFDFLGFEKEAEPCYWKTYEHGWRDLPADKQSGFFVGFGSTLRNNFEFAKSEKILKEGLTHFPTYPALKTFLAFTLHTQGKFKEASEILFAATLEMPENSFDGYEHPMKFYVENLNTFPVAAPEALYQLENITIRAARPSDAAEIANVHLNSWREAYVGQLDQEYLDWLPFTFRSRKQHWEQYLAAHVDSVFVAEGKNSIMGFISINTPSREEDMKDWAEVGAIYLLQRYKGKKVGLHLLKAGFKAMQDKGFTKAYCWMLKGNPTGKFYESTGAVLNGKEKIAQINQKVETEVMYCWTKLSL